MTPDRRHLAAKATVHLWRTYGISLREMANANVEVVDVRGAVTVIIVDMDGTWCAAYLFAGSSIAHVSWRHATARCSAQLRS